MPSGSLPDYSVVTCKGFDRTVHGYLKKGINWWQISYAERWLIRQAVSYWYILKEHKITDAHRRKVLMLKDFGMMFKGMDIVLLNLQYGDVQEEIDEFDTSYRDRGY